MMKLDLCFMHTQVYNISLPQIVAKGICLTRAGSAGFLHTHLIAGLHFFGVFCKCEGLYHFIDVSVHKGIEVVDGHADAVIGHAALGKLYVRIFAERSPVETNDLRWEAMASSCLRTAAS